MGETKASIFQPGIPLYRQVQQQIQATIDQGCDRDIPLSDAELSERFGVSRITVRRAVDELVDAGILYRIQGVGTFVRPRKLREKLTLNGFLDTWSRGEGKFAVEVSAFRQVSADKELAAQLKVQHDEPLIYVQRLRFQKDVLVAVDDRYLIARHCRTLTKQDVLRSSIVDHFQNREKIRLDRGDMDIEARLANAQQARALKIRKGRPVLVRRVTFYDTRSRPVFAGISLYRADLISYRVSVAA
jgi:GntR family transcriptional regulator